MDLETWKDIKGFEGIYQISNNGKVKSLPRSIFSKNKFSRKTNLKLLSQTQDKDGYWRVYLYSNCRYVTKRIHRLVAEHFIDNPFNKNEVNHKDLNKDNNSESNLEWSTRLENMHHARRNGVLFGVSK